MTNSGGNQGGDWNQQSWGSANPQPSANPPQQGWEQQGWDQQGQAWNSQGSANPPQQGWDQQGQAWNNQQGQGWQQEQPTQQGWDGGQQNVWGSANPQPSANPPTNHDGGWDRPTFQGGQDQAWGNQQGQQAWGNQQGQQAWGAQQPQGQQAWGQWDASGAQAVTPEKKKINPIIPIVVALAVLLLGGGIYALTRHGDDEGGKGGGGTSSSPSPTSAGISKAVEGFFDLLNTQQPNSNDFEKFVTDVGTMGFYEATNNSPGGQYKVKSVGDVANGKVPVTFTHEGTEIKSDMAVKQDGEDWKLVRPFASVTFTSDEKDLYFKVNDSAISKKQPGKKELYYPGVYTIKPDAGYGSNSTIFWKPKKEKVTIKPGETVSVPLDAEPTKEWLDDTKKSVQDAFKTCLEETTFYLYNCPFTARNTPTDAEYPTDMKWEANPSDAASKAEYVKGSVSQPCYVIKATMNYNYLATDGSRKDSEKKPLTMKGCYSSLLQRVSWTTTS